MGDNKQLGTPLKQQASEGGRVMRQERQEASLSGKGGVKSPSKSC